MAAKSPDRPSSATVVVLAVTNPLAVTDAVGPETLDETRQIAPEEFLDPRFRAIDLEVAVCVKPGHIPRHARHRPPRTSPKRGSGPHAR